MGRQDRRHQAGELTGRPPPYFSTCHRPKALVAVRTTPTRISISLGEKRFAMKAPSGAAITPPISSPSVAPAMSARPRCQMRSEEHTSELQSLMRISYAVFCLKKKTQQHHTRL